MMNIVKLQDQLKNFSQEQLVKEMQSPSGNAPQYLVLGEIMRRKDMQGSAQQAPETTVAQEAIAAAGVPQGGIASMAQALAPKTDMVQNTGIQAMAEGGYVKKMAEGGDVMTDPETIARANQQGMSVAEFLRSVGAERAAAIAADVKRRAAQQPPSGLNVFDPRLPVTGTQADSGDMRTTYTQQMLDSLGSELSTNPTRYFGGTEYYGDGLPTLQTAQETFNQDNPAAAPRAPREVPESGSFLDAIRAYGPLAREIGSDAVDMVMGPPSATDPMSGFTEDFGADRSFDVRVPRDGSTFVEPMSGMVNQVREQNAAAASSASATDPMSGFTEDFGMESYDPNTISPGIMERVFGAPALERAGIETSRTQTERLAVDTPKQDTGTPLSVPAGGIETLLPPAPAAPEVLTTPSAPLVGGGDSGGGGGGGGGGSGGLGAVSGMSSYEQELINALNRREKAAEQDKWLALAQVGLNLMSSTNPTPLGALGEAGLKGVEALRGGRDQYEKDRLDLMGALEQSRASRASAAARAARGAGGGGLTPLQAFNLERDRRKDAVGELETVQSALANLTINGVPINPGDTDRVESLRAYEANLMNQLFGASTPDTSGAGTDVRNP